MISKDKLVEILIAHGASPVMFLDDPVLMRLLGYKTMKAASRRRERGVFPRTTSLGKRPAVLLPDLAAWLHDRSAAMDDLEEPQTSAQSDLPRRKPGRPRKPARSEIGGAP